MKKHIYKTLALSLLSTSIYAASAALEAPRAPSDDAVASRSAEVSSSSRERYYFKDGTRIERDAERVYLDGMQSKRLFMSNGYNDLVFTSPLDLSATQSQEAFLAALERTGAFDRADDLEKKRKSNWTRSYLTKVGVHISHLPNIIEFGSTRFVFCTLENYVSDFILSAPLVINLFQTEEEFTAALVRSGIYDPADEAAKKEASNWTRSYITRIGDYITLTHSPESIIWGNKSAEGFELEESINGIVLAAPLELGIYQTEEEFTAALIKSGIYDPAYEAEKKEAANWTGRFITLNGVIINHRPDCISFGPISTDSLDFDAGASLFGNRIKNKFSLGKYQSREEFTVALTSSGIYDPICETARILASNWKGSFFTKSYVNFHHMPQGVIIGSDEPQEQLHLRGILNRFKLKKPLLLSQFQTPDEFKAALEDSGLLFSPEEERLLKEKADWTGVFTLKNGQKLVHSPDWVFSSETTLSKCVSDGEIIFGLKPKAPFFLHTYMSPEEFEAELKKGELI